MKVLVIGATGRIGHLVVDEAIRQGHTVRALARDRQKARRLPKDTEVIVGDLTRPEALGPAVDGLDAIVFTHGSDGESSGGLDAVHDLANMPSPEEPQRVRDGLQRARTTPAES